MDRCQKSRMAILNGDSNGASMKAADFKPCVMCGKGVMHTGIPLFYRVKVERFGILANEVQRTHAMEQFMGGHVAIARVFHDPELTQSVMPEISGLVCESCSVRPTMLAGLVEQLIEEAERSKAKDAA